MRTKYKLGDEVYLNTDPDQFKRMVAEIRFNFNGTLYMLVLGPDVTLHYEQEIITEKSVIL